MSGHAVLSSENSSQLTSLSIDGKLRTGLALLGKAYMYAQDANADAWDFALRIDKLYEAGLSISELRWLVARGFAKHGQETSVYGDPHRSFRQCAGFNFENKSCLVLTPSGASLAIRILRQSAETPKSELSFDENNGSQAALIPNWDPSRRVLFLSETVVKRFRVPARNQETILSVFQEEGWPEHIDDPLPGDGDIDPHTRLHDAIHRLNGHQTNRLVCFHGNGHGTGVIWELL